MINLLALIPDSLALAGKAKKLGRRGRGKSRSSLAPSTLPWPPLRPTRFCQASKPNTSTFYSIGKITTPPRPNQDGPAFKNGMGCHQLLWAPSGSRKIILGVTSTIFSPRGSNRRTGRGGKKEFRPITNFVQSLCT